MQLVYRILHRDGHVTWIRCDLGDASSPIAVSYDGTHWDITHFQTADARHREHNAAALILHYTDRPSCAESDETPCDCADRIDEIAEIPDR